MRVFIERKDYEFLLLVEKFCSKVDKYVFLLGLDREEVEALKEDNKVFSHVFNSQHYGTCAESFVKVKIEKMRIAFARLEFHCKYSRNYNFYVGEILGIESEMDEYLFHDN